MPDLILAAFSPMAILAAIVGLGGLIFFHELGHFLACRVTGTRVEAFSIGFGKEIFGWTRGHTRYRVGIVPLGGYVKMAAENPGERNTGAPDEFPNKSFGARLLIMGSGVLFNCILAFLLFVWAFFVGVPFYRAEVGSVAPGEPAWKAGLQQGDLITHADGARVLDNGDLQQVIALSHGEIVLTVVRDGATLRVPLRPNYSDDAGMPTIGIGFAAERAAADVAPGSPVAVAGGRAGDVALSVNGVETPDYGALLEEVTEIAGRAPPGTAAVPLKLRVRRENGTEEVLAFDLPLSERPQIGIRPYEGNKVRAVTRSAAEFVHRGDVVLRVDDMEVGDFGVHRGQAGAEPVGSVLVRRGDEDLAVTPPRPLTRKDLFDALAGTPDFGSSRIAVRPGMAAERAGLKTGDRVVAAAGKPVQDWGSLVGAVAAGGDGETELTVDRDGTEVTVTMVPSRFAEDPGYMSAGKTFIHRETSVGGALATGWSRSVVFGRAVLLTVKSLVTRRVSAKQVGGPIMLANVTYRMFQHGLGKYLYILAIISINLAVLNLLPIPILDGGQIVLLCVEKLRGKPLPERIVGYYQMVGLVLILGLMALALSNDVRTFILN